MPDDLTILKSSLLDRANALRSYVDGLKADSARSDSGFRDALDICAAYTRAFARQLSKDWEDANNREERQRILKDNLESFLTRERWIDQRFSRGSQRDVPRALKTIARLEFRNHDLEGHEPVLTVGPPDSFETHQASLAEFLFTDIYPGPESRSEKWRHTADLSIFSVPYIEGTRVLWYPIALGHEVAHIRLDRSRAAVHRSAMVEEWLRDRSAEFSIAVEYVMGRTPEDPGLARPLLGLQVTSWATELLCDLNAVRLFGPAGLSAIAEFLAILEFQSDETLDAATHPPLWVRLEILFAYLDSLGWADDTLPAYAAVWREQVAEEHDALDPAGEYAASRVRDAGRMQQMFELVSAWGAPYKAEDYNVRAIHHVRDELLDGIPGATHAPSGFGTWREVTVHDVVNAAWAARRALDDREAGERVTERGVLLDGDLEAHEKRVKVDSLASKAIDTLELSRLWGPKHGIIPPDAVDCRAPLTDEGSATASSAGVISRRVVARLVEADRRAAPGRRLVVTPLFEHSVQDAAVDLRLGPDFIVFRHSAITAFTPLAEDDQDPRTMQERVHKGWGERFILHPQELVLASTLEYIVLPDDVAAQVLTRSSYGRLGLLTATAVQVQPGSRGCITLELVNQGETPIALSPGARVAQLMAWTVSEPCVVSRGKYWFPVGPEFSRVGEDPDVGPLSALSTAAAEPAAAPRSDLRVRIEADRPEADAFYDLARSLGADDAPAAATGGSRRLGADLSGLDVPALILGIVVSIRILAVTVQRWLQGSAKGVVIIETGDDVIVRPDAKLPRGSVVIKTRDGVEVRRLDVPPDDVDDIAQALRAHLPR